MSRRFLHLVLMATLAGTISTGQLQAAVQVKEQVCSLRVLPGERNLYLREGRLQAGDRFLLGDKEAGQRWSLSAPTIANEKGQFLAWDSQTRSLRLSDKRDTDCQWRFDIVEQLQPAISKEGFDRLKRGVTGSRFHLIVGEGELKGWYFGFDPDQPQPAADAPCDFRPVTLVADAKNAVEFSYIDTRYRIVHK